jgi:hypothetical protein
MQKQTLFTLTIPLPVFLSESERSDLFTILRRKADGPLIVREWCAGRPLHSKKESSRLRYTTGVPFVRAHFSDRAILACVSQELSTCVPQLARGQVGCEHRRAGRRQERTCTCVLDQPTTQTRAYSHKPHYSQVATCPRHGSRTRDLLSLIRQQARNLSQDLPPSPIREQELVLYADEAAVVCAQPVTAQSSSQHPTIGASMARRGRKVAFFV